jgi:predicted O-methyltransferase YrrM
MEWEIYNRARELHDARDYDGALLLIGESRPALNRIRSHVACLEASCHDRKGNRQLALRLLEQEISEETTNFWVYYQIAGMYETFGRHEDTIKAYQKAHALQGWLESGEHGYMLSHDFFSPNIPVWSRWFSEAIIAAPIKCLEIGSWEGASSAWLLDKIVSQRGGSLTCIDTFEGSSEHQAWLHTIGMKLEEFFDHNITATGHADLCRKLIGKSQKILLSLMNESFDFIYIDGAHEAKYVIQDAILCWNVLRPGGHLLFDDVDFHFPNDPEQDTGKAIDAFLTWFSEELVVVERNRQLLIKKITIV